MTVEFVNLLEPPARSENGPGQRRGDAAADVEVLSGERHESVKMDESELRAHLAELNQAMLAVRSHLRFSADEESGRTVIKVIDTQTEELIRQIPPEHVFRVARTIREGLADAGQGIIFEAKT